MSAFDHWMKFNIGDYLADTMHLSTFQHGIYVLLIMHYFKRGSLPVDERALARIAKVPSTLIWRKESPPVMALFRLENGAYLHTRIDSTRADAQRLSEKRKTAGKSGAAKRWGMANANAEDGNCHDGLACARATPEPSVYQSHPPHPPKGGQGGGRADWKNGFGESADHDMQGSTDAEADNPRGGSARVVPIARRAIGC